MIKLFRHIRQSLIQDNKMGKYFKYALGEIVLVVVGILIALQINTWNEARKQKAKLKVVLSSVYQDLIADSLIIDNDLQLVKSRVENNNTLKIRMYSSSANLDTLINIMKYEFPIYWYGGVTYNTNTFNNLKSTGSFDILPQLLKKELSDYYTLAAQHTRLSAIYLDQYRKQLDQYLNTYNMVGRIHSKNNYKESFLFNDSWRDIESKDFTARSAVLFGAYTVLYTSNQSQLQNSMLKIKRLLPIINSYLDR